MEFSGERFVPSLHGQIYYEHVHRYAIAARFSAGKRVLDIASGEGYGSSILARVAAEVTGVDIDDAAIAHARSVYYASNLRFMLGSALEIPLADGSVEVAASFETIEHIGEPERMLDELSRVLAPEGLLIISSPNKRVYSDLPEHANPFHVRELYFSELRDLLQRRFRNVVLYGQRLVAASVVHPLAGAVSRSASWYNGAENLTDQGLPTVADPVYFFAICTDGPFDADACSAFLDPGDDVLADLSKELDALRRHYALTVHGPGSQNGSGNGTTALSSPAQASLTGTDSPALENTNEGGRYAEQVRETERVTAHYENALVSLREREEALAAAAERERSALAAIQELRSQVDDASRARDAQARETERVAANYEDVVVRLREREAALATANERERSAVAESERARAQALEAKRLLEAQVLETERVAANYEELVLRLREREAALAAANERERLALLESARVKSECDELGVRLDGSAAALAASAAREEERSLEVLRLTAELRDAAIGHRTAASAGALVEEERDMARRQVASLQAALENTEESLFVVRQAFDRGRELAENQRAALSYYERSLEAAEATRLALLGRIDDVLAERARADGTAAQLQATRHVLAERSLQLAAALASADRLRVLLADGFADRDRALESLNALLTEAARTESARAERAADALAERTLALGEALASAAGVRNLLDEGLADRERSFEAMRALVSERDRALEEARTVAERASRHAEQCLEEALGDEVRRGEALLEKRTLQLADSLAAAAHTRATMIDVLRIYREAFELLHARHGADRRAALRAPNVVRRAAGRLAREAKARFPAPLVRFAGSALRRTRRA